MEGHRNETLIRKGPWMAEEDEILMDYVKKYGPRDWSSIRSKGLLPRTGKSCRLRWVNKLKPDLKTGCKFSAEEERVVIDLQARFGNKWARIATYLPGRTDNDVKNFWSTRRKRLARILQTSTPPRPQKNNGKTLIFPQVPALEAPSLSSIPMEGESSSKTQPCQSSYIGNTEMFQMLSLPDLLNPNLLNLETNLLQLEFTPIERKPCIEPTPEFPFIQLPQPPLDIPIFPESLDIVAGPVDTNLSDEFKAFESRNGQGYPDGQPFYGLDDSIQNGGMGEDDKPKTPDSFFDDFPMDMFDYLEPLPSSSEW